LISFWFSNSNYPKDKFLLETARKNDGWVPISVIATFNKLKSITTNVTEIAESAKLCPEVQISDDGLSIKRKDPIPENFSNDDRVVRVSNLPKDESVTNESIKDFFSKFHNKKVLSARLLRHKNIGFLGMANVELESPEDVKEIVNFSDTDKFFWDPPDCSIALKAKLFENKPTEKNGKTKKSEQQTIPAQKKNKQKYEKFQAKTVMVLSTLLLLKGLPSDKLAETKDFFSKHGRVRYADKDYKENCILIRFQEPESTQEALKDILNDNLQIGGIPVTEAIILQGDEERVYWEKIIEREEQYQKNHINKKPRNK